MSYFSAEDRQRMLAEALATVERTRHIGAETSARAEIVDRTPVATEMPFETRSERDRRELDEQERRFARERRSHEHRLDSRLLTIADVESLISAAIATERAAIIPALRDCVDQLLEAERAIVKSELAQRAAALELQVTRLEASVSALEMALNVERSRVLDLPSLPLKNVN